MGSPKFAVRVKSSGVGLALWLGLGCGDASTEPAPTARAARLEAEAAPFLVRDLRPGPTAVVPSANPASFVQVGTSVFFTVDDQLHGRELWRTDGTPEGSALVTDLMPGREGSIPTHLTAMGGQLYFVTSLLATNQGLFGLWRTDGTPDGTRLLLTLRERPSFITEHGGALYFEAPALDSPQGFTLWKSDGTPAGTQVLKEVASAFRLETASALWVGDRLYFSGQSDPMGPELWTSDGTPQGTRLLADRGLGKGEMGSLRDMARLADRLLFWGRETSTSPPRLWITDGTGPGTQALGAVHGAPTTRLGSSAPIVVIGNTAYFNAWDAQAGQELWRTDGTPEGTARVADLVPGIEGGDPVKLTAHEGRLYFLVQEDAASPRRLWKLDTPDALPEPVAGAPVPVVSSPQMEPLRSTPAGLFFQGWDYAQLPLWRTDGTPAGTQRVASLASGRTHGMQLWAWDRLIISASDGQLLLTDGTPAGTSTLPSVAPRELDAFISFTPAAVNLDGTLFFVSPVLRSTSHGPAEYFGALWASDGTADGTREVLARPGGYYSRGPFALTPVNGRLLFLTQGYTPNELWSLNGTTHELQQLDEREAYGQVGSLIGAATRAYFTRWSVVPFTSTSMELWMTDGTAQGTVQLARAPEGSSWSTPRLLATEGDRLYFAWTETLNRDALWVSDGSAQGTVRIKPAAPDTSQILGIFPTARRMFVLYRMGETHQVWGTEGTERSTRLVAALPPDLDVLGEAAAVGDTLYLVFNTGEGPPRLWRLEGQTLEPLHTFGTTRAVPQPQRLTALGNRLVFWASDGVSGYEPWTSDGTPGGTVPLKDLNPGPMGAVATPGPWVPMGPHGPLVFAASDGTSGMELWRTDGTPEGTVRVADVLPGPRSSSPGLMAAAGRHLFFSAWTPEAGRELWALPIEGADVTPPHLTCPGPLRAKALTPEGAPVDLPRVAVMDTQDAHPTLRMSPASGSTFPPGTTTVRVTATDATGNMATCTFDVEVVVVEAGGCQQAGGGASPGLLGGILLALWALRPGARPTGSRSSSPGAPTGRTARR
ncbi:HYR domain-containing protein [Corallococcus aberystwythensis]|uniref:HYR domain-containing protein n=1 Tax=Corallococcus aberystwythensis TaxID=2316722 RepID=A0A3A8QDJ3_9BACT|nr:HYR domain-containing protein [Corallococcus aberystwythensis]RKH66743.1 HYR domain-containing protein [Corallococcus aberystwythensis]